MASEALPAEHERKAARTKRIILILAAMVIVLALTGWIATIVLRPHPPSPEALTKAMRAQAALTGGAKVYVTHCAYCHDKGFGPSIAGRGLPPEAISSFVRIGPGMMPAFPAGQVSDSDIAAVASYVNGLPVVPAETDAKGGG